MSKGVKVLIGILIALAAAAAVFLGAVYFVNKNSDGFLNKTYLNGTDIGGETPDDVAETIASQYGNSTVQLTENGTVVLTGSLADFGYTFNQDALETELEQQLQQQKSGPMQVWKTLLSGDYLHIEAGYDFDETKLQAFCVSSSFSVPRVESSEASIQLNTEDEKYEVVPAVQGNMVNDATLQADLKTYLDQQTSSGNLGDVLTFEIPSDVYTSQTVSTDTAALQQECDEKNKALQLDDYKNMSVTYTFGDQTEVLDGDTIISWLTLADDGSVTVDDSKIADYVAGLASKYNTRYLDRQFTTTGGQTITISGASNEYGYTIDQDAECKQLKQDILSKQSVTREPCYVSQNDYGNPLYYQRSGTDDLAGTYVEVDITKQHLWFYKDGQLVVESDVVTGDLSTNQGTELGVFPLAYKESPSTLKGEHVDGTPYSVEVQYWMPFFEGEGLHDASWRSAFGGTIYQTDGSNGCVNCPPAVAKTIYDNIEAGMAIVIYEES